MKRVKRVITEEQESAPCSICKRRTVWFCSDCMIDTGEAVAVCPNGHCRDEHEKKSRCTPL